MSMVDVRGYTKKDGTRVRAHRRRYPRGVGLTISVAIGGIASVTASSPAGSGAVKPGLRSGARPSKIEISAEVKVDFKRAEATLRASGYKTKFGMRADTDCAAYSYGQVHDFFKSNPCKWLARAYVVLGDSEILVAISWVGMPNASLARRYKKLVDTPGSGNVTELSRDVTRYRKLKYGDGPHTSGIHGADVWNVQVRPIFPKSTAEITEIIIDSRQ
jgi:hypothetical protein